MFNTPESTHTLKSTKAKSVWAKILTTAILGGGLALSLPAQADMMKQYNTACATCHQVGALGSPKTGDKAAWSARLKKGMPALVASTRNGMGNMPARGLCDDCTDADLEAIIKYMSK